LELFFLPPAIRREEEESIKSSTVIRKSVARRPIG